LARSAEISCAWATLAYQSAAGTAPAHAEGDIGARDPDPQATLA
jgi:hypothetical protein